VLILHYHLLFIPLAVTIYFNLAVCLVLYHLMANKDFHVVNLLLN